MDEKVNAAESQIKVQLQRRADLIPNLVETVKGYAKQEQTIFIQVAEARAKLAGAVQSGDLQQMAQANAALTAPLGRLIAIAENYPQLKSNENFRQLQDQLEGTENRIAVARQDYNESVNSYNAYIRRFPQVLTAKVLGKKHVSAFYNAHRGGQGRFLPSGASGHAEAFAVGCAAIEAGYARGFSRMLCT
jgi:LemA protein